MTEDATGSNPPHVRLTRWAKRAGCAAKHPPGFLFPLLARLPKVDDARVLVGSATADDAAIVAVDPEKALVLTTDFFTPIVDDPYDFGAIAAANALSDVYAMGGSPIAALNLVGFPDGDLPASVLEAILRGGAEKSQEAGISVVGGHTIRTDEPIYGLAVTGVVPRNAFVTNAGAQPGDLLVLTKPIGAGVVTTAAKQDKDAKGAIAGAIATMKALNRDGGDLMVRHGASAATDVTGFGLLGHLRNLLVASQKGADVWLDRVPVLEGARAYLDEGIAPGGTHANRRFLADWVRYEPGITPAEELLLCDAQTSGGLLVAIHEERAGAFVDALARRFQEARPELPRPAIIGRVSADAPGRATVIRREPLPPPRR